jgi:alkanesulfonate monooxygenase SsuD/methylene tetrahydromethanopterin reductase-like flavin-dependent oxidoreductase (luciferase family)
MLVPGPAFGPLKVEERGMQFSLFLSCYCPESKASTAQVYGEMLDMARAAERLGFSGLTVPEHHFINILMNPNPFMLAVKVASVTEHIPITTAVAVLPLNDMRRMAGEAALADVLTGGRLGIGVGRGAFPYEFVRYGVDFAKSREIFDESLEVLIALLSGEEVSWDGAHYKFDPVTIMPRPVQRPHPPIWIAAMAPDALYHCAKRGLNIQTTPLQGSLDLARKQVDSFREGAAASGREPRPRLSLLRVGFATRDQAHTEAVIDLAYGYYRRFDNVFKGPGEVAGGRIRPIEIEATRDDLAQALFIGTPEELVEKFSLYAELGVDEINLNLCIGAGHEETLESIERLAREVMPRVSGRLRLIG